MQACTDTVWYREARANPKKHLPKYYAFLSRSRIRGFEQQMDDVRIAQLVRRAEAFLEGAEAAHLKWNGTRWTRARHLFGVLCLEERRGWFAAELLSQLGEEELLKQAEISAAAAAGAEVQRAQPSDKVDELLRDHLRRAAADGSLKREIEIFELDHHRILSELALLATAAPRDTEKDPVLSDSLTPRLHAKFIPMLFVGLAHNLLLESYVSRMKWAEKRHPNMHALTLDHLFMFRARRQREKDERRAASMRSTRGGGARKAARERAAEGRALVGASRNKQQQQLLCRQAEARAGKLAAAAKAIFKRGAGSISSQARSHLYVSRLIHSSNSQLIHTRCARRARSTGRSGESWRRPRWGPWPAPASSRRRAASG